jgi:hypothetical protein
MEPFDPFDKLRVRVYDREQKQSLSKKQTTDDRGQMAAKTRASARNRRQRTEAEIAELPKSSPINFPPVADSQDHDLITL